MVFWVSSEVDRVVHVCLHFGAGALIKHHSSASAQPLGGGLSPALMWGILTIHKISTKAECIAEGL